MDWNYYPPPGIRAYGISSTNQDLSEIMISTLFRGYCNSTTCAGTKVKKYGIEKIVGEKCLPKECPDCSHELIWFKD